MIYPINPNMLQGIPDTFLPLKYVDDEGPIIFAVDQFDPPGAAPETEVEWDVVARSFKRTLESYSSCCPSRHEAVNRHLDVTAAILAANGVELRTMAHSIRRQWGTMGPAIGAPARSSEPRRGASKVAQLADVAE